MAIETELRMICIRRWLGGNAVGATGTSKSTIVVKYCDILDHMVDDYIQVRVGTIVSNQNYEIAMSVGKFL